MTNLINVRTATMSQLVAFFNANTGGNPVKKFADRPTAEKRVQKLIDEMAAEIGYGDKQEEDEKETARELGRRLALTDGKDRMALVEEYLVFADGENGRLEGLTEQDEQIAAELEEFDYSSTAVAARVAADLEVDPASSRLIKEYGTEVCPHCGIDLCNGVGQHLQEVNGKIIKHDSFEFECLACGNEFGPSIPTAKAVKVGKVGPRPAMVQSLKIDRRIVDLLTGEEYANACQVWKAGLVSAAQGDRLSAVLYGAFKTTGKRDATVAINGHTFRLAF